MHGAEPIDLAGRQGEQRGAPGRRALAREGLDLFVDASFGLTLIGWAAVALFKGRAASVVPLTLVAVNVAVGALFLLRRPPRRRASPSEIALCLPSVLTGPVAMAVAPAPERWPVAAQAVFVIGALGLLASLRTLGGSFGILPALREVVSGGPYRLVRHPIYAAELLMVIAAAGLAGRSLAGGAVIAVAAITLALRILVEERLLSRDPAYAGYRERVRHRLLPGIW